MKTNWLVKTLSEHDLQWLFLAEVSVRPLPENHAFSLSKQIVSASKTLISKFDTLISKKCTFTFETGALMIYLAEKLLGSLGDRPSLHLRTRCWQMSCQKHLANNLAHNILQTNLPTISWQQHLDNNLGKYLSETQRKTSENSFTPCGPSVPTTHGKSFLFSRYTGHGTPEIIYFYCQIIQF